MGDARDEIIVKVLSNDGYGELAITIPNGATYGQVAEKYASERYVPADSVVITTRTKKPVDPARVVPVRGERLEATVVGLCGLRKLFELYDGGSGLPGPNVRPEAGPTIEKIVFGNLVLEPWHRSPYPRYLIPGLDESNGVMWLCDVCLRYTADKQCMAQHIRRHGGCAQGAQPPGDRVFTSRDGKINIWKVDGGISYDSIIHAKGLPATQAYDLQSLRQQTQYELYCLHLGLLARFFLKGKTAFYCPGSFYYYVLTEEVDGAGRFRGFYSVEKGQNTNSLACIMVLPPWQDRGFGRLLIHASYLNCVPRAPARPNDPPALPDLSPERPLSDLGMVAFLSYWKGAVIDEILNIIHVDHWQNPAVRKGAKDIDHICIKTRIRKQDVIKALHVLNLLVNPGAQNPELDWVAAKLVTRVRRVELELMTGGRFIVK